VGILKGFTNTANIEVFCGYVFSQYYGDICANVNISGKRLQLNKSRWLFF